MYPHNYLVAVVRSMIVMKIVVVMSIVMLFKFVRTIVMIFFPIISMS